MRDVKRGRKGGKELGRMKGKDKRKISVNGIEDVEGKRREAV